MAEESIVEAWKTTVLCRFYANGVCREGDRCKYLHEDGCSRISSDAEEIKNVIKDQVANPLSDQKATESHEGCSSTSSSRVNGNNVAGSIAEGRTESVVSGRNTSVSSSTSAQMSEIGVTDSSSSGSDSTMTPSQVNTEPVICHFFQQGRCMFGNNCRNRHVIEDSLSSSSSSRSEDAPTTSPNNSILPVTHVSELPQSRSSCVSSTTFSTHSSEDGNESSSSEKNSEGNGLRTTLRVNAPEFVPSGLIYSLPAEVPVEEKDDASEASSGKTWAQVVNAIAGNGVPSPNMSLCPYAEAGDCPYAERCTYLHGDTCEFCGRACLHPANEEQRKSHTDECIKQHEREMELAFAVARSRDKQCGVCFEVVVDKNPASEQRFGILPNCNHCFCLACIRKWRQAKQFENKIIRACPECRVTSDFVCPSMYWVDTKEEKDKLILAYKDALSNKQCKYFKQGRGKCPFGNKCFYLHAYPDGTKVDTGPPIRRQRQNADGDTDVVQLFLWDFLDERDNRWLYSLDDLDLMAFLSGSDDSDTSDIEIY